MERHNCRKRSFADNQDAGSKVLFLLYSAMDYQYYTSTGSIAMPEQGFALAGGNAVNS
jgi:hypothetical protein